MAAVACMEDEVRFRVRLGAATRTETGEASAQPGKTHLRSPRRLWSRVSKAVRLQLAVSKCFTKAIDAALCDGHQQHSEYLHKLKGGVLTRAQAATVVGDKRIETTQEALRSQIAAGRVFTQVSSEAELNVLAFWQQGDVDLSTAENLKVRHHLKYDESVRAALHAWWAALQANGLLTKDVAEPVLQREGYETVFLRFHKLLLDTWNYDEAKATIAEDWIEDLGGSETRGGMPQEVFFASLFELADLWTPSIDAAVYAEFLRRLLASCFEAGGKLCSLDAVTFDSALTSDKSERKPRKSKSRHAKRHAQAVERQKAATRIQANGRRKIEAREVENRRKAAKLITSRARAGIQGRKVRRELPPKPQALLVVLARPQEDASGEPKDSFSSRVSNARFCASPTSERSGPFSRRESMPYPSIPGQLGKWQPWKLRTEIVDVVEETLLERRALHDDERYRAASKRRGMMAHQRKASLAARRAKLAEEERQRAARRARLENERQALRVEELLAKDKKQHDAHMAARQSSWQSKLLTLRHEAEVSPPAVAVKYAAQHASVAPMTPALRTALVTCGSSDSASHEPPSPASSSGAKIKWRRSPSAPEAALHRIRSAGTLSSGAMSGSPSMAAVSGTHSSPHPLSGCAKRMPTRAQTASLESLRRSAEQILEEGATSPRKADCPVEGRPSRGRLASSEEHRALLHGAQRLQNPHPSRSPFWRVRDALEDLGTEVTWRPAPVYGEPPAKWLHQVLPTPFFSI